jgi:hypothetical protein
MSEQGFITLELVDGPAAGMKLDVPRWTRSIVFPCQPMARDAAWTQDVNKIEDVSGVLRIWYQRRGSSTKAFVRNIDWG